MTGKGQELDFDGVEYENVDEGVRFLDEFLKPTSACLYGIVLQETIFAMCVSVQFMGVAVLCKFRLALRLLSRVAVNLLSGHG